jgi:hypothetical protein
MNAITLPSYSAMAGFLSGVALTLFNAIPWVAVFMLTQLFGVRLYTLNDKEICQRVQRRLVRSSHVADGGRGYGISVGRWYYASVSIDRGDGGDRYSVWMVATNATYTRLTADDPPLALAAVQGLGEEGTAPAAPAATTQMSILERIGSYYNIWWRRRKIICPVAPRPDQNSVIDRIVEHQKRVGHTVALLHGPPGTGKSMIGVLLTSRLGGTYCNTLRPWQPGDTMASLYEEAEPTAEKPLVVVFDEVDSALIAIHAGVPPHKAIPIAVADKPGWNRFLDEIGRGMYPHLILILTTNRSPEFIRGLDPSYIRPGRVDLVVAVKSEPVPCSGDE